LSESVSYTIYLISDRHHEREGCASQRRKKKALAFMIDSTAHQRACSATTSCTRLPRNQSTVTRSFKISTVRQKAHGDPEQDPSTQSSRSLSLKDSSKQNLNPPTKPRDESTTLRQKVSNLSPTPKKCSPTFSSASAAYDASSSNL